jgi:hypothetical protein
MTAFLVRAQTLAILASLAAHGPSLLAQGSGNETKVFGISSQGGSVVYVFDRSLSMQGAPLVAAKRELAASLGQLKRVQQFQILFYNERTRLMQPPQMTFADENGRRQAESFVESITAAGATDHVQALKLAMKMGPEVIFFLTDADEPAISDKELDEIRRANSGSIINAIEFKSGPDAGKGNYLRKLAEQNRGEYTYVDATKLPKQ